MTPSGSDPRPWPSTPPSEADRRSFAEAAPEPYWSDRELPPPRKPLEGDGEADLAVVGGGLTGLWTAIQAKQRDPGRSVMLLEGETVAFGASGRNGGFMSSSLTHGIGNGLARFPEEMDTLERLGRENLREIFETIESNRIECDLVRSGVLTAALTPGEEAWLAEGLAELVRFGHEGELLDAAAMRSQVDSPTYRGGLWQKTGEATVDPVKLCLGLADLAERLGVRVHEHSRVEKIEPRGEGLELRTYRGRALVAKAVLATAAFRSPLRQIRSRVVPVYDYVLVTEPLSEKQWQLVGWESRQGVSDSANQFHYYRPTADGRILWGGYDAVYNFGNGIGPHLDQREESFAGLAQRFFTTFPQLEGVRFSHRWGGAIDTCSRFFAFYGTTRDGKVAYAVGHTGLGVGASRFSGGVALDLLDGVDSEASRLRYARSKPLPFPPEPLRSAVINLTRNRLEAADARDGRRGLWLRTLDRLGLGFDS